MKEKFGYLKKLEGLERKGVELTKKYSMESSLQEMMGEYEMIISEKERENSVKFQGNMLSAVINGVEFLNNRFDPFDIKLDGWGEQFGEATKACEEEFSRRLEPHNVRVRGYTRTTARIESIVGPNVDKLCYRVRSGSC